MVPYEHIKPSLHSKPAHDQPMRLKHGEKQMRRDTGTQLHTCTYPLVPYLRSTYTHVCLNWKGVYHAPVVSYQVPQANTIHDYASDANHCTPHNMHRTRQLVPGPSKEGLLVACMRVCPCPIYVPHIYMKSMRAAMRAAMRPCISPPHDSTCMRLQIYLFI